MVNQPRYQWIEIVNEEDFKIWNKDHNAAPSTLLTQRVECYFRDISPDIAFECMVDLRVRKKWDHRLAYYQVLEVTRDYQMHYNKLMKVPIPMLTQRDRVLKQHIHKNWPI